MDFDFKNRPALGRLYQKQMQKQPQQQPLHLAAVPIAVDHYDDEAITSVGFDDSDLSSAASNNDSYRPDLEPYMSASDSEPNGQDNGLNDNYGPQLPRYKRWIAGIVAWVKNHRRTSIIIAAVLLLLIAGGVSYALTRPSKTHETTKAAVKPKPKAVAPAPITSPLTGLVVSADEAKRATTGVMIENTTFARPQSGLKEAGVVYEAIAEAGITRFLALYQESKPANIGPVRSSRPYYVDWARSFDAAYGHVGGSPDALAKIKTDGIKDLDQFANAGYYHRISSRDAPHNVYTNMEQLDAAKTAKGWTSSTFTGWPRKAEVAAAKRMATAITAKTINVSISGETYNSHYDYVPETNSYNRSEGGAAHIDAESSQPLSPKVVIALAIPYNIESDGYHSHYEITGTGNMVVFQDGTATKGTWKRASGAAQYEFSDEAGHVLKLNPGQTWVTAVADIGAVTYAP